MQVNCFDQLGIFNRDSKSSRGSLLNYCKAVGKETKQIV